MTEKSLDLPLSPGFLNLAREMIDKAKWVNAPEMATGRGVDDFLNDEEIEAVFAAGEEKLDREFPVTGYRQVDIDGVIY